MADGALTAFTARLRPFYDRLDIEVEWLFYWQPNPKEFVPTTVFVPRWWENREHWIPPGVGTVPGSERPYFGRVPPPNFAPFMGEDDWWLNGLSYAKYLAGGYPEAPCWELKKPDAFLRIRQRQDVRISQTHGYWSFQLQDFLFDALVSVVEMRQAQRIRGEGSQSVDMRQEQDLLGPAVPPVLLDQVQDLLGPAVPPMLLYQEQRIRGEGSQSVDMRQEQDLLGPAVPSLLLEQVQDLGGPGLVSLMISQAQAPAIIV